jgi:hypothetical protein
MTTPHSAFKRFSLFPAPQIMVADHYQLRWPLGLMCFEMQQRELLRSEHADGKKRLLFRCVSRRMDAPS